MRCAWIVLVAACPGSPKGHLPESPVATLDIDRTWVDKGDAACPSLDVQVPGAPPGAGPQPGHVVRSPGEVHCEAAGLAHGPAMRTYPDGSPQELGVARRGRREGYWQTFHPNGQVATAGVYQNGAPIGVWSRYAPDGRPVERGEKFGERRVGVWLFWDRDIESFEEYGDGGAMVMQGRVVDGDPKEMLGVCGIGYSFPQCRVLPIVDLGARADPTEGMPAAGKAGSITLDLGAFVNVTEHHSIGASYGWQFDATYPSTLVEGRYRYWVLDWLAVEAGAGKISGRDGHPGGLEAHVALVGADVLSLTATAENRDDGTNQVLFGVRLGLPGIGGAALVLSKK